MAAGLALSACASASLPSAGGPRDGDTSPKTVRSNAPAASPAKATPKTRKHAASEPKSCQPLTGGTEDSIAQLVDVRVGTHDGYDRVTLEFAPPADEQYFGLPRYELAAATPPIREDGSGEPLSVDGSHFAAIVFTAPREWSSTRTATSSPTRVRRTSDRISLPWQKQERQATTRPPCPGRSA